MDVVPIPGARSIGIRIDGKIIGSGKCDQHPDGKQVTLTMFGEDRVLDRTYLMVVSQYGLTSWEMIENAVIGPIAQKLSTHPSKHWLLFKQPMHYKEGYRIIPLIPVYAISEGGEVVDGKDYTDLARKLGMKATVIRKRCLKGEMYIREGRRYRHVTDSAWPIVTIHDDFSTRRIRVTDLRSGKVNEYTSLRQVERDGYNYRVVKASVEDGKPRAGILVEYVLERYNWCNDERCKGRPASNGR